MQMQQEAEKAAAELPMETEVIQQQPTSDNDENTANTTSEVDSTKVWQKSSVLQLILDLRISFDLLK